MATAWGNIIIKDFNWEWTQLTFKDYDDWSTLAVVNHDHSQRVLPFAYLHDCINNETEVKISALITALQSDVIPTQAPGSYTDIIEGIQRLLPRS